MTATSRSAPRVSVIVPVRNRRDLLRRALDALDKQEFRDFEVVVVDDGSTDGADVEAVSAPVVGRAVRLVRSDGSGAVAARLRGVAESTAEVLAFTDSDCEPEPGWLAAALRRIDEGMVMVHGLTLPARPMRPLERSVTERNFGLFPTCNLVVTRAAYDAVGGFDRTVGTRWGFRIAGRAKGLGFGEDTVFGWSIARQMPVAYEDEMVVRHHVFSRDLTEWISRSWQMGAFPAMVREVPELRATLMRRRVLWGKRSRVPVYATMAAALTRRPGLVALAASWWVLHRYRYTLRHSGLPLAEQLSGLPPQLLLDAIQATSFISGSVRARTVVL